MLKVNCKKKTLSMQNNQNLKKKPIFIYFIKSHFNSLVGNLANFSVKDPMHQ